jgi:hypothetical protein
MASPKKKSPSTKKKSYRLTEADLALAATIPAHRRKSFIKAAVGGDGYDYYKGVKTNLDSLLNIALSSDLAAPLAARKKIRAEVAAACIGTREIKGNQGVAEGLYEYVFEQRVTAAPFDFPQIALGKAGTRRFWAPYILKIGGKKYIPFFDFRQGRSRSTRDSRRFIFSIQHTHIRLANPTEYGDVGFVIFTFTEPQSRVRKLVSYFDAGVSFWNDEQIGGMIDAVYRDLEAIKKAA